MYVGGMGRARRETDICGDLWKDQKDFLMLRITLVSTTGLRGTLSEKTKFRVILDKITEVGCIFSQRSGSIKSPLL